MSVGPGVSARAEQPVLPQTGSASARRTLRKALCRVKARGRDTVEGMQGTSPPGRGGVEARGTASAQVLSAVTHCGHLAMERGARESAGVIRVRPALQKFGGKMIPWSEPTEKSSLNSVSLITYVCDCFRASLCFIKRGEQITVTLCSGAVIFCKNQEPDSGHHVIFFL